jgi:hypothetical protein
LSRWLEGGGFGSLIAPRGHNFGHSRAQPLGGIKSRQRACQRETQISALTPYSGAPRPIQDLSIPCRTGHLVPNPGSPSLALQFHDGTLRGVRLGCNAGPAGSVERLEHLRRTNLRPVPSMLRPSTANGLGSGSMLTRWRRGTGGLTQAMDFQTCQGTRAPEAAGLQVTSGSGHVDAVRGTSRPRV